MVIQTNTSTRIRQGIRISAAVALIVAGILLGGAATYIIVTEQSTGPRISISACGTLDQADATYVLQGSVRSDGTCFSIAADNVTLDLNSQTVYYGQREYTGYRYGVAAISCDDPDVLAHGGLCASGSFQNFNITNGAIVYDGATQLLTKPVIECQNAGAGPCTADTTITTASLNTTEFPDGGAAYLFATYDDGGVGKASPSVPVIIDRRLVNADATTAPPAGNPVAITIPHPGATLGSTVPIHLTVPSPTITNLAVYLGRGSCDQPVIVEGSMPYDQGAIPPAQRRSYCHAIRVGQGSIQTGAIHDLDITISGDSSAAVAASGTGGGLSVYSNTIRNKVATLRDSSQFDGASIKLLNDRAGAAHQVYDNIIKNGPQAGIVVDAPNSTIDRNYITQGATYLRDYCVAALGNYINIENNTCKPTSGRGILVDGALPGGMNVGTRVISNTITAEEERTDYRVNDVLNGNKRSQEYAGCPAGGSLGLDLGSGVIEATISNNTISAVANSCDATAFRLGGNVSANVKTVIQRNSFVSGWGSYYSTWKLPLQSIAAAVDGIGPQSGIVWQSNILVGNTVGGLAIGPQGVAGLATKHDIVMKTSAVNSNEALHRDWTAFRFGNTCCSTGNTFQDILFMGTEYRNPTTNLILPMKFAADLRPQPGTGYGPADYAYTWTTTVFVRNTESSPLSGASIQIKNSKGAVVTSGTTNSVGTLTAVLPETRVYNSNTVTLPSYGRSVNYDAASPYTMTISRAGYYTTNIAAFIDTQKSLLVTMTPSSGGVNTDTTPPFVTLAADTQRLGGSVTLSATASDTSGISRVDFIQSEGATAKILKTVTAAPYTYTWDTASVTGSAATVYARAVDDSLAHNEAISNAIILSRIAPDGSGTGGTPGSDGGGSGVGGPGDSGGSGGGPTDFKVHIIQPGDGASVGRESVAIAADVSGQTGATSVQFVVDNSIIATVGAPYTAAWDATNATIGYHLVYARATDASGATVFSPSVLIYVTDKPADPSAAVTLPARGAQLYGRVKMAVAVGGSKVTVKSVKLYRDTSVLIGTDTKFPYLLSIDTAKWKLGKHQIYAKVAIVVNGKAVTLTTKKIPVSVVPNTIRMSKPRAGTKVSGTKSVIQSVVAGKMAGKRVRYYVDGKKIVGTTAKKPYTVKWNTRKFKKGSHLLTARIIDSRGRTIVQNQIRIQVKN